MALLNVLWAPVNFVVRTATTNGMPPATVASLRWTLMAVSLFALLSTSWFRQFTRAKWPDRRSAGIAVLLGALMFGPAHLLYYTSLQRTSTVEGTVLGTTSPLWTALFAFILLREKVAPRRVAAIALGFAGAWIVGIGFALPRLDAGHTIGNGLYLTAVLLETGTSIFTARLIRRSSGITILAFLVLGAVPTLSLAPLFRSGAFVWSIANATPAAWIALGYLVLIPGLFCFGTWYRMVERMPLSLMIVTLLLQPPLSAAVGWYFLGERITADLAIGTAVILSALLVGASEKASDAFSAGEVAHDQ